MHRRATRADVIAAVAAVAARHPDRTVLVGIDGFGGSGKTSLAGAVVAQIARAVVVHIDDFARPSVPEWEWDRFTDQVLRPLERGRPARYQIWDWHTDSGREWVSIDPGCILIVEGVSCTRAEVRASWDLTVWVEAPADVRLHRAVERDGPDMLPTWLELWIPAEQSYAAREHPQDRVDLLVDGTDPSRA